MPDRPGTGSQITPTVHVSDVSGLMNGLPVLMLSTCPAQSIEAPVTGQRTGSLTTVKPADALAVDVSYRPGARNAVAHVPRSTSDGMTVHLAPIFGFHVLSTSE